MWIRQDVLILPNVSSSKTSVDIDSTPEKGHDCRETAPQEENGIISRHCVNIVVKRSSGLLRMRFFS